MITIGLTTWSEHQSLINDDQRPVTLAEYAANFPVVEIDTSFYAIPSTKTIQKWQAQVPSAFHFILKAPSTLTFQSKEKQNPSQVKLTCQAFAAALEPLREKQQLTTALFQFPPFFHAERKNINYLAFLRQQLPHLPIAIEFRHQSWYKAAYRQSLIRFCQQEHFTLVAADEPQSTMASVPFVIAPTNQDLVLLRFHGRNSIGWRDSGKQWRKKRTLYRYSKDELAEFKNAIQKLEGRVNEICVIFNNNSAGDAAPNAKQLQQMLDLHFKHLGPTPPEQTKLF